MRIQSEATAAGANWATEPGEPERMSLRGMGVLM